MGSTNELGVYAEYLRECELAAKTQVLYLREAEKLDRYLENKAVTKQRMLAYKEHLETLGYATTTRNQRIVAVNR